MSHTNQTPNYDLPQFMGTDKPAWLVDFNQAMSAIDTQMKANETAAGTAEADAQSALSGVTALNSQVSGIQTSVTALETQAPLDEAQIETNRQNIATNAQNIVKIDNRLGHTSIASIGDGTVTGAIAELDARPSVSDADDVTYDNTDSGLTATNVQDAIDELASSGSIESIRYDETTGYIQCKDAQGWFNWRKATRDIWNAITNTYAYTVQRGTYTKTDTDIVYVIPADAPQSSYLTYTERVPSAGTFHCSGVINSLTNARLRIVAADNAELTTGIVTLSEITSVGTFTFEAPVSANKFIAFGCSPLSAGNTGFDIDINELRIE